MDSFIRVLKVPFIFCYGLLFFLYHICVYEPLLKFAKCLLKNQILADQKQIKSQRAEIKEKDEEISRLKKTGSIYNHIILLGQNIISSNNTVYFDVTPHKYPVILTTFSYNDICGRHLDLALYGFCELKNDRDTWLFSRIHHVYCSIDKTIRIKNHTSITLRDSATNYLYISDFQSRVPKLGYGSSVLKLLFKECEKLGVNCIVGELAYADRENFSYTIPFYEKNGFDIYLTEDRQEGAIIKYLNIEKA